MVPAAGSAFTKLGWGLRLLLVWWPLALVACPTAPGVGATPTGSVKTGSVKTGSVKTGSVKKGSGTTGGRGKTVLKAPDTSRACNTFSRGECFRATHCTLVLDKSASTNVNYLCRDAQGPCEKNMAQSDRATCESRPGCTLDNGGCYCHCKGYGRTAVEDKDDLPACSCVCAGGPPPRCRSRAEMAAASAHAAKAAATATAASSTAPR